MQEEKTDHGIMATIGTENMYRMEKKAEIGDSLAKEACDTVEGGRERQREEAKEASSLCRIIIKKYKMDIKSDLKN